MMAFFHTTIYVPIYNTLIFLIDVVPGEEVALAIILLTILVRVLMFPIAQNAIRTQIMLREINPELDRIKEEYKDDKEEQARQMFALYKDRNIKISAPFLMLFVQLPIFIGLYFVILNGGLPAVNAELLYSFVPMPVNPNMDFLGIFHMAEKSISLAVLAGLTQFVFTKLSLPPPKEGTGFKHDLAKNMHLQMQYFLPVMMAGIAYFFSAAIALYLVISNLFSIGQEMLVRHRMKKAQV